jgi:hypothetical protein
MGKFIDLTGLRFGRWVVIEKGRPPSGSNVTYWKCRCDCGSIKNVARTSLMSGDSNSCGCLAKEVSRENMIKLVSNREFGTRKQFCRYDLTGEYGIDFTKKGKLFLFDKEDYDKIKVYCWCNDKKYMYAHIPGKGSKGRIYLHQLVMGRHKIKDDLEIDHINHNSCDNRKINLRVCTHQQNDLNKPVKGYFFNKKEEKWIVRIQVKGKNIYIGAFTNETDAKSARKKAEQQYFGEFVFRGDKMQK